MFGRDSRAQSNAPRINSQCILAGSVMCALMLLQNCAAQSAERTIAQAMQRFAPNALLRLQPAFRQAGVAYPPSEVVLLASKQEKTLELWAKRDGRFRFINAYPIIKASGVSGPKLREGDKQVPEGTYRIVALNPNSLYHLSLKLDYPNAFDRVHARNDGRTSPGSNIFIHGKARSVGCLAMGDKTAEDLFVLAEHTGLKNIKVVIAPHDPRKRPLRSADSTLPHWTGELYRRIELEFARFPRPTRLD